MEITNIRQMDAGKAGIWIPKDKNKINSFNLDHFTAPGTHKAHPQRNTMKQNDISHFPFYRPMTGLIRLSKTGTGLQWKPPNIMIPASAAGIPS